MLLRIIKLTQFVMPVICSICAEYFSDLDNISYTSCGHVYHFECIDNWMMRSDFCPICRSSDLDIEKIFLSFDDGDSTETLNDNLQVQLCNVRKKMNELKEKLDKSEKKYIELEKEYNLSESNFLNLHKQYTESDENVKTLEATVADLSLQLRNKSEEIFRKTMLLNKIEASRGIEQNTVSGSNTNASTSGSDSWHKNPLCSTTITATNSTNVTASHPFIRNGTLFNNNNCKFGLSPNIAKTDQALQQNVLLPYSFSVNNKWCSGNEEEKLRETCNENLFQLKFKPTADGNVSNTANAFDNFHNISTVPNAKADTNASYGATTTTDTVPVSVTSSSSISFSMTDVISHPVFTFVATNNVPVSATSSHSISSSSTGIISHSVFTKNEKMNDNVLKFNYPSNSATPDTALGKSSIVNFTARSKSNAAFMSDAMNNRACSSNIFALWRDGPACSEKGRSLTRQDHFADSGTVLQNELRMDAKAKTEDNTKRKMNNNLS
uniref:RING-type domain-containing protein n=1 Tax=Glossina brevipalpis TaxID=37001 RepID=A0A1A9WE20_9MUSC